MLRVSVFSLGRKGAAAGMLSSMRSCLACLVCTAPGKDVLDWY